MMERSLIHLLIFAVLSMHLDANSYGLSADRNLNSIKVSRKIRSLNISQNFQTVNENEKRAVLLWVMKDFIKLNLELQLPFSEEAQRGKAVYTRMAPLSEEIKIADVLVDVSKTQIELLIKRFESQSLLSNNELQTELSQNFFIRQISSQFLNKNVGQSISGSVSFIDTSISNTRKPKGSIAYAFMKLNFNQESWPTKVTGRDLSDLKAYLKTAVILYHHEKNGPKLLSLQAEQIDSEDDLPDQIKRTIQQSVTNAASPN